MDRRKRESEKVKEGDKRWVNVNKPEGGRGGGGDGLAEQFRRYEEI